MQLAGTTVSKAVKVVDGSSRKGEKKTSIFKSSKDEIKSDGRPSISSLKKSEVKARTSLFKKADPKLRIRPFKSKVTFSDEPQRVQKASDTQTGDHQSTWTATTKYTIPDRKSTLTINLDKYDLSASSPELNKATTRGKFPYSRHKLSIDKTESEDRLMNIRMTTGSSASVVTASELFSKLPIETLLQLGLPSNQSSQSSEQKLGIYPDQRDGSSSFSKITSGEALDTVRCAPAGAHKLKNEIPETYLHKPSQTEANRRKSFQLQSSQTPIEMHSEYDINYQEIFKNDSNDYWLRHRSLPNIQEIVEDSGSENPSSPTSKDTTGKSVKFTVTPADHRTMSTTKRLPKDSQEQLREKQQQVRELTRKEEGEQAAAKSSGEQFKHNAQERRTLYSKASKSSSSSNQSASSLQRKCRKKIPVHLSSIKTNSLKQSSTDSDSSYYTAHSVHITIPELETLDSRAIFQEASNESICSAKDVDPSASVSISMPEKSEALRKGMFHTSNESTNSSANLSYHSASELFKSDNLTDSTQSLSTEASTIPTIVVMPTSPVTSEPNMFFGPSDEELQQDRRRRLMEHFHLGKEKNKALLDTEVKEVDEKDAKKK